MRAAFLLLILAVRSAADGDGFEKSVRPVFVEHCQRCHGAEKQKGGFRLDTRGGALKGGDTGPAIVPRKPEESLLLKAVRRDGELKMPPDKPLPPAAVKVIEAWIASGAVWPEDAAKSDAKAHWAFRPVRHVEPPAVTDALWCRTPVDRFILAALESKRLKPAAEADRRMLIRRATYDITGLPPTAEEVEAFVNDRSSAAYETLIDRLLASPHYGEHWGRHWLDLARYSDSKGYVYDREEKFWVHAWTYRDWVVKALNDDMPYDRFITLQLAADHAAPGELKSQAAMGFLTVGRRFLGVTHDIIDDRIDVISRGLLGLTVGCARCHGHKFDPISIEDYYALAGVFRSSREKLLPLAEADAKAPGHEAFKAKYAAELAKFQALLAKSKAEVADRIRARVGDYLLAQFELSKYPEEGFDIFIQPEDILPAAVRQWRDYLARSGQAAHAVWSVWHDTIAGRRIATPKNRLVREAFAEPPKSREDLAAKYAALFADVDKRCKAAKESGITSLDDPAVEEIRAVLYGPASPCEVPAGMMADIELFFPTRRVEELWKQRRRVDRVLIDQTASPPQALVLEDRPDPSNARVFRRGNPATPGDEVPRRFPMFLGGQPLTSGSGRLALANAITDPANPLTARVIVNRLWQHHFGQGLVRTPSDFGTRADPPSHPELLDWLANELITNGWSLKKLHRTIALSAVYRQAAASPPAEDPENRLLACRTPRRLSFEEIRDSLFAMTGDLDNAVGGRAVPLFPEPFTTRRSLYGMIDREYLPGPYRAFDFANPDMHASERSDTIVPQQSLFFLNHPLPLDRVRALAAKHNSGPPEERVQRMYRAVYQRDPTPQQIQLALKFVNGAREAKEEGSPWAFGYGDFDNGAVKNFTPFAIFTGDAWQAGHHWPDPKLGWMRLTADGGHAAEKHVVVRRWTSPVNGRIAISSRLQHKPKEGDGVRGLIIASRGGELAKADAFKSTTPLEVKEFEVRIGDTIDFVIDKRKTIDNDEFLWVPVITVAGDTLNWDARRDFRGPRRPLTAWEQLAQVLVMANEFTFVD